MSLQKKIISLNASHFANRTLSTDNERDDDDEPEVVEATCRLLRMLDSSSTCCRERENELFAVQQ